jgi:hypothetical protein
MTAEKDYYAQFYYRLNVKICTIFDPLDLKSRAYQNYYLYFFFILLLSDLSKYLYNSVLFVMLETIMAKCLKIYARIDVSKLSYYVSIT